MIVVACLNPALDVTHHVPDVDWAGVKAALGERGIPAALTRIAGETRRTFTVVDGRGGVASFHEAGPRVGAAEFAEFRAQYARALTGSAAVVLPGSLPPGRPPGTYAALLETATAAAVPAVLDTHGEALRHAVALSAVAVGEVRG